MKKTKALLSILLTAAMLFALCACSFKLGGETTWNYDADQKDSTVELFDDFFKDTFRNTNQVVTVKNGENVIFVENIDGTSSYVVYTNSPKTCSFRKDNEYYYAFTSDDAQYYMTGEEAYGYGYYAYKQYIDVLDDLPEEGLTYSCKVDGKSEDGKSEATLALEIKKGSDVLTINAAAKDGLVESATISQTMDGNSVTMTLTFAYGSATVTIPDISDWYNASNDFASEDEEGDEINGGEENDLEIDVNGDSSEETN